MSGNVATLAGGAAGAFIGSFFGMPGLGFSIGSSLAGLAFAPKAKGNSVDPGDLSFDTSAYGKFQPWGYGTYLVQGPVTFWSTDYVAHKHTEKVGGKGGGAGKQKVETITYTRSFAVYLADCTNGTPIVGVRRIWDAISGQMLYDVGEGADAQTIIASQSMAKSVRVYTGALDQQPDPLIEAHEGWAPAWRGHAYVVFEDWDHGGSKQAPVLAIEVATVGTLSALNEVAAWDQDALYLNQHPLFLQRVQEGLLTYAYYNTADLTIDKVTTDLSGQVIDRIRLPFNYDDACTIAPVVNYTAGSTMDFIRFRRGSSCLIDDGLAYGSDGSGPYSAIGTDVGWWSLGISTGYNFRTDSGLYILWNEPGLSSHDIIFAKYLSGPAPIASWRYDSSNSSTLSVAFDETSRKIYLLNVASGHHWLKRFDEDLSLEKTWDFLGFANKFFAVQGDTIVSIDAFPLPYELVVYRLDEDLGPQEIASVAIHTTNTVTGGVWRQVRFIADNLVAHPEGIVYIGDILSTSGVLLSDVANDLCARADLTASEYDTSLLPSTPIRLTIDRLRSARDWLTELGNIYRFRLRNSGGTLQIVPKGGSPVATIGQADLGLDVGEGIRPPITASRTQGIDLPRSVTVVYSDADNDYAPGQQQYVMRQYPQGQDITLTVTAILTGAEALELAQIAAKEPHLERLSWTTSVGIKHLALEAGDVVDLPTGRAWVRDIQEQGDSILRATFVAEAAAAYTGNGLPAPATTAPVRSIALAGPTRMELLDIPILQDADDGPGVYLAALGYLSGWQGAEVYRSDDGEVYDPLASVVTVAVVGTTTGALASGPINIWDRANTLNVTLIDGSLSSASELNVLNGANAALVGAHGRWEIIQFETATLEADGSYTLSKLLRGRKGTEWAVGTHQAGDTFVLLTSNTLGRVDKSFNDIGVTRQYKAVSFGNDISAAAAVSFSNAGVGLKPYAVSHVTGSRNGSGDLTIKWIRRTRIGGEWRDYVDASLGEASESYEVDIMNGSTVVRTIAVSSPTATYTAADQTGDFGSTQSSITVRVYQLSADIGRGYSTEKTL